MLYVFHMGDSLFPPVLMATDSLGISTGIVALLLTDSKVSCSLKVKEHGHLSLDRHQFQSLDLLVQYELVRCTNQPNLLLV